MHEWRRWLYSLLFFMALPVILLRLYWRGRNTAGYRERWWQRLGYVPALTGNPPLWIHAVSVGETVAIIPLVERLLAEWPDMPILITTMTPTGASRVSAHFGSRVHHLYCPYDLPFTLNRFLRRIKPRACMIVETELWPNMIHTCHQKNVPVIVVNARLSERSLKGYQKIERLTAQMLSKLTLLIAQGEADAQRFAALGMPSEQIRISGSIKFDFAIDDSLLAQGHAVREHAGGRFTVILASSHSDEEQQCLTMMQSVWQRYPDLLLIIVPRHPERFDSVWEQCLKVDSQAKRRSEGALPDKRTRVYLGDSMGELMGLYAAADLVVMGGSFVDVGGHNPVEPAALGIPVIMGPYHHNFAAISAAMAEKGGMLLVNSFEQAAACINQLIEVPQKRQQLGSIAKAYADSQRGALDRVYHEVTPYLS